MLVPTPLSYILAAARFPFRCLLLCQRHILVLVRTETTTVLRLYLSLAQLGNLPLHYAVMNQASETVVRALFETHPDGARETGEVTM